MAKGTESKAKLFSKIQEFYPDAFWEDEGKILRVPMEEGGNIIEIKVTLTAAKTNLGSGELKSAFGPTAEAPAPPEGPAPNFTPMNDFEVTPEEKENVAKLIAALNPMNM